MNISDVFNINFFRRSECISPNDKGIRISNEILQFLLTLECVYLAIEKCDILIVFDTDLNIFSANLIADGAEVKVLRDVVKDAIRA